jgi:putative ATPase
VLVLERLSDEELSHLLERAETELDRDAAADARGAAQSLSMADGDGRALLNLVEQVAAWKTPADLDAGALAHRLAAARGAIRQVGGGALQPDLGAAQIRPRLRPGRGALLVRADAGGRRGPALSRPRITRMAVEDIGLADPAAQRHCLDAWATYERLGSPEGELALAQAVLYLALAPKSNATYTAYKAAPPARNRPAPCRRPSIS